MLFNTPTRTIRPRHPFQNRAELRASTICFHSGDHATKPKTKAGNRCTEERHGTRPPTFREIQQGVAYL